MLDAVLKPGDLENTVATIVLSLDTPWEMMQQLSKWIKVLQKTLFDKLLPKMEKGLFEKMKQNIEDHVKTYEDPVLDENGKLIVKSKVKEPVEGEDEELVDMRKDL
jgi:hypothetical protein